MESKSHDEFIKERIEGHKFLLPFSSLHDIKFFFDISNAIYKMEVAEIAAILDNNDIKYRVIEIPEHTIIIDGVIISQEITDSINKIHKSCELFRDATINKYFGVIKKDSCEL